VSDLAKRKVWNMVRRSDPAERDLLRHGHNPFRLRSRTSTALNTGMTTRLRTALGPSLCSGTSTSRHDLAPSAHSGGGARFNEFCQKIPAQHFKIIKDEFHPLHGAPDTELRKQTEESVALLEKEGKILPCPRTGT